MELSSNRQHVMLHVFVKKDFLITALLDYIINLTTLLIDLLSLSCTAPGVEPFAGWWGTIHFMGSEDCRRENWNAGVLVSNMD